MIRRSVGAAGVHFGTHSQLDPEVVGQLVVELREDQQVVVAFEVG